jgi:hypothetical protein
MNNKHIEKRVKQETLLKVETWARKGKVAKN